LQVFDDIATTFADLTAGFCEFRIQELTIYIISTISFVKLLQNDVQNCVQNNDITVLFNDINV